MHRGSAAVVLLLRVSCACTLHTMKEGKVVEQRWEAMKQKYGAALFRKGLYHLVVGGTPS